LATELTDFFGQYGNVTISLDSHARFQRCCYIDLNEGMNSDSIIEKLNGSEYKGNVIYVKIHRHSRVVRNSNYKYNQPDDQGGGEPSFINGHMRSEDRLFGLNRNYYNFVYNQKKKVTFTSDCENARLNVQNFIQNGTVVCANILDGECFCEGEPLIYASPDQWQNKDLDQSCFFTIDHIRSVKDYKKKHPNWRNEYQKNYDFFNDTDNWQPMHLRCNEKKNGKSQ
jgi:hypothetical protein